MEKDTKKINVLLVDDEEKFVTNVSKLLKSRDFEVEIAFDGFHAIEILHEKSVFDVVVLDVKMPKMDGITALKTIKKCFPKIEVIMLTGHAKLESGIQAIREGAFDYLMKPCDIEDLSAKIREAYEVESIKKQPVLWPRKRVYELIHYNYDKLKPDDYLIDALNIFNKGANIDIIYIVDKNDMLLGCVTKRILINEAKGTSPEHSITWDQLCKTKDYLPQKRLSEIMLANIPYTLPEEPLSKAAHKMIENKLRTMPVIRHGKTMGVVQLQDIFFHMER
ncbi:MAG: response regulator [Desulfobacterales bacterium]|nr:response regulator [Desulfobacterales bacterium]MBF0397376.1 response regulator [Desulfobacterales bacterium]